jgi:copper(I)-binding protein
MLIACRSQSGEMVISDAWGRSSPTAVENGAFYLTLTNETDVDDALVAVDSTACMMTELHEGYTNADGTMGMRHIDTIALPAGETVELKPGGMHIMCMGKRAEFNEGSAFAIDLTFKNEEKRTISAEIQSATAEINQ